MTLRSALAAADEILALLGGADSLAAKGALAPLDPGDFAGLATRISARMWLVAKPPTVATLESALKLIVGADWQGGGGAALDDAVRALGELPAGDISAGIVEALEAPTAALVTATRGQVARITGSDVAALSHADEVAIRYLKDSQGFFVTDEIGRRVDEAGVVARQLAAEGIAEGASNAVIGARLADALEDVVVGRGEEYYAQLGSVLTSRARAYASISGYAAAGIRRMKIVATLDRRTCQTCHWANGRVINVGQALERLRGVSDLANPGDITEYLPWPRVRRVRDDDPVSYEVGGHQRSAVRSSVMLGGEVVPTRALYFERNGDRVLLARIDRDATEDKTGIYANVIGKADLENSGIQPPFHSRCRCVCLPQ